MSNEQILEISLSHFNGRSCRIEASIEQLSLEGATVASNSSPGDRIEQTIDLDPESILDLPAKVAGVRLFHTLPPEVQTILYTKLGRLRICIDADEPMLQELPWEHLSPSTELPADRNRWLNLEPESRTIRFHRSSANPRPRLCNGPPQASVEVVRHALTAKEAVSKEPPKNDSPVERNLIASKDATLAAIVERLSARHRPAKNSYSWYEKHDAILVLATRLRQTEERTYLVLSNPEATPSTGPLEEQVSAARLCNELRALPTDVRPRVAVISNWATSFQDASRLERRRGQAAALRLGYQLSTHGTLAVIVLPWVRDPDEHERFLSSLYKEIKEAVAQDEAGDIGKIVGKAYRSMQPPPEWVPVVITNTRSGAAWYVPKAPDLTTAGQPPSTLKTLVIGPRSGGLLWTWQQSQLPPLARSIRFPMYDEHHTNPALVASFLQAMGGSRDLMLTALFMSWIDGTREYWKQHNTPGTPEPSVFSPDQEQLVTIHRDSTTDRKTYNLRNLAALVGTDIETLRACRIRAESLLMDAMSIWKPRSGSYQLDKTIYWEMAKLDVGLYVTIDPSPLLYYALLAQGRPVQYYTFPRLYESSHYQYNEQLTGSTKSGKPAKILYLAGRMGDPGTLLLSEDELHEGMFAVRTLRQELLLELGDYLGVHSEVVFGGFDLFDPLFRLVYRTLFSNLAAGFNSHKLIAIEPTEDWFAYPQRARTYLKAQFQTQLNKVRHRLLELALNATLPIAGANTSRPIEVFWGSFPEYILGHRQPSAATSSPAPPPKP